MTEKLKTLKDLTHKAEIGLIVDPETLREEAIKWLEAINADPRLIYNLTMDNMTQGMGFIMYFFNLTEDERTRIELGKKLNAVRTK